MFSVKRSFLSVFIPLTSILITSHVWAAQQQDTTTSKYHFKRVWQPAKPINDPVQVSKGDLNVHQVTEYFDGLNRPVQTVMKKSSPGGNDLVNFYQYDSLGRQVKQFLPYTSNIADGKEKVDPITQQRMFYSWSNELPYAEVVYERSPAGRVIKSMKPGNLGVGEGKGITENYLLNNNMDSVREWYINPANDVPLTRRVYSPGELEKKITTDENNNQTITYTNREGKTVQSKVKEANAPGTAHVGWLCTYYIYDDLNNLRHIIPPLAVRKMNSTWDVTTVSNLCVQYKYDDRGRMIMKKTPDKDYEEMVYDRKDRLVFSRDGIQRKIQPVSEWSANFYDELGRIIMTAVYPSNATRDQLQAQLDGAATDEQTLSYQIPGVETLSIANYKPGEKSYKARIIVDFLSGFDSGTNADFLAETDPALLTSIEVVKATDIPAGISGYKPLTYTYYDNYNYPGAKSYNPAYAQHLTAGNNPNPQPVIASNLTDGMTTGMKTRLLGTDQWLTTTTFYDEKGRVIQQQADNPNGGVIAVASQYDYEGKVLSSCKYFENRKAGVTPEVSMLTIFEYDQGGRVKNIRKRLNNDPVSERTIVASEYTELDQTKLRKLGVWNDGTALEVQNMEYNIRGEMTFLNRDYVNSGNGASQHFGLNYMSDNVNLVGMRWRGYNYKTPNWYLYSYNNANQLNSAHFFQSTGGGWVKGATNFSVDTVTYDANGNILAMKQMGLKATSSVWGDNLTYKMYDNSNRLKYVRDAANDPNSTLSDFKEPAANNTGNLNSDIPDYQYDVNGNLISDSNKGIAKINYNYLSLPETIHVIGKGTISFLYDADGSKWRKTVVDSTTRPVRTIVTDYIGEAVYNNDSLEVLFHEGGRIRPIYSKTEPPAYVYDFFIKDHLGNVRTVLTEQSTAAVYAATMESSAAPSETLLFSNVDETRAPRPAGYPADNTTSNNEFVSKLSARDGSKKVGPSLVLRVMTGDTISAGVKAFYKSTGPQERDKAVPATDMVAALVQSFGYTTNNTTGVHGISTTDQSVPFNTNFYNNEYQRLKEKDPIQNNAIKPKAYLNFALFDDQFKLVEENSGVRQVKETPDQLQELASGDIVTTQSGFLYIYTSNESQQDVYFDNLVVTSKTGTVLEETHYYPFGGVMDGISSRAVVKLQNKILYQGKEMQRGEFSDGSGLEWYDFEARYYDQQIGRWFVPDPKNQFSSPYLAMGNRPTMMVDPDGRWVNIVIGAIVGGGLNLYRKIADGDVKDFKSGLAAFGVGAVAGVVTVVTGGAAASAAGFSSVVGIQAGALAGGVGAAYGSAVQGVGNAIFFQDPISMDQIATETAVGIVTGGVGGGISAKIQGRNIWTGGLKGTVSFGDMVGQMPDNIINGVTQKGSKVVIKLDASNGAGSKLPELGNKLNYLFGKATGSTHNIERSTGMLRQLESVGIFDNAAGNSYIRGHLGQVYNNSNGIIQPNGRVLRESILMGRNGGLKMESIWEGDKLITVKLLGGR